MSRLAWFAAQLMLKDLRLAQEAGAASGTVPAVLNAANEVAVAAFLEGALPYPAISETVASTMGTHQNIPGADLEAILDADAWARRHAAGLLGRS